MNACSFTSDFILSSSSAEQPIIFSASLLKTENQAPPVASENFAANIYLKFDKTNDAIVDNVAA